MSKRLTKERLKRLRSSYWRATLRQDRHPADPQVLKLFRQLQQTSQPERKRELWQRLLCYLTTLEVA
jgi:hypothetical protein